MNLRRKVVGNCKLRATLTLLVLLWQCDVKSRRGLFHLAPARKETDCSVNRNLPVHAGLVTVWCEATGTT